MAVTGKTGADALYHFQLKALHTLARYAPKLDAVITAAQAAGAITASDATILRTFVAAMAETVTALKKLADYSGF
jgi:hypothetical protein